MRLAVTEQGMLAVDTTCSHSTGVCLQLPWRAFIAQKLLEVDIVCSTRNAYSVIITLTTMAWIACEAH